MSLVDSCAVDADPLERALDGHAEQQVAGLGRRAPRRSARSTAAWRSRARSSPRPWPGRSAGPCPPASSTSSAGALGERVGGPDRLGEVERRRSGAAARAPRRDPARHRVHRQRHADHAGRGDRHRRLARPRTSAPAPCILAASSRPRPPVAALALPELATTARMRVEPAALHGTAARARRRRRSA